MQIPGWRFLAGSAVVCLAIDVILALPHVLAQQIEWQTAFYAIGALAGGLALGALVDFRMDVLERKLDESLNSSERVPGNSARGAGLRQFTSNRTHMVYLAVALGFAFLVGLATGFASGFWPSLDPLWASVIVTVGLVIATLSLMRENRLFRMEAVKPAFGFEFGIWPPGGVPSMWNLKNSGGLARTLRIDIKQGDDTSKMFVPSCGREELVQLGQDFKDRYERGGKLTLGLEYRDTYRRAGQETLEIDFDDLKRSGRSLPYSFTHVAALEEIVEELRRLQRD